VAGNADKGVVRTAGRATVPAAGKEGREKMRLDQWIREAETRLFARGGRQPEESFVDLASTKVRLRVLSVGTGPSLLMLHGVGLAAAAWRPGSPISPATGPSWSNCPATVCPVRRPTGLAVRDHSLGLMDDLFDALGMDAARVVGHSLGGMFALWYAAARPGRITSLVAIGDPAVALPGATVRMPLSMLTVPVLGEAILRTPSPRPVFRRPLGQGLSPAAAKAAPVELVDVLRLAAPPQGQRQHRRLAHARDRPRPQPAGRERDDRRRAGEDHHAHIFCWGTDNPFLSSAKARPCVDKIPGAVLQEVPGGHGPWLEDPHGCAKLVIDHFGATGFERAV
jgi:pimeloyl-ACP methyl ester carboxylesterase